MSAVLMCLEDCRNAAFMAGFPAECGLEILDGCLQDLVQGWSQQQFEIWFREMEAKYGQRSKTDISLNCLYRNILQRINADELSSDIQLNSLYR